MAWSMQPTRMSVKHAQQFLLTPLVKCFSGFQMSGLKLTLVGKELLEVGTALMAEQMKL